MVALVYGDRVILNSLLRKRIDSSLSLCRLLMGSVYTDAEYSSLVALEESLLRSRELGKACTPDSCDSTQGVLF